MQNRDVIGYLDADGTATVTGRRLPAEQAAAACARIEDLAKAAKRAVHSGRIGPLRADIYVGLLEGRWQQLTRDQIIADLLAHATSGSTSDDNPAAPDSGDSAEPPAAGKRVPRAPGPRPQAKHGRQGGAGSCSCTSPLPCSPSWLRTPPPAASGPQ